MKKILLALLIVGIATAAVQASHISDAEALKAQAAKSKEAANKLLLEYVNSGDLDGIESALKMGADVNAEDHLGHTVLEDAIIMGANPEVVKRLLAVPDINLRHDTLLVATSVGDIDTVKDILNAKVDVNASGSEGWTALMIAVDNNFEALASLFLAKNAYVDAQNKNGATPLMLAAANNSENLINMLLARGANVMLEDNNGQTAADYIKIDASDSESYRKHKMALKNILQEKMAKPRQRRQKLIEEKRLRRESHIKEGIEPQLHKRGSGQFAEDVAKQVEEYLRPIPEQEKEIFYFEWERLKKAIQAVGAKGGQAQVNAFTTIYKDIKRRAIKYRLTHEQKDILNTAESLYKNLMKLDQQKKRSEQQYGTYHD